ncbi:hypothetical protein SMF1_0014 [Sulfolobales Mexican fusellovirus 1]|uniref:hypothetical protein n=1 Tax=Sulfolobales Mexican fusellovirus 1 TaxID=1298531 RepID=UPI0002C11869|nr:hypothetical protein SMF1_0014 [Sulfolobales Mexican fusellovirus 1]AGG36561.1 hypothetical protein SMF1_0014 [Sulfolobales Mexican fusellovirus 1]
MVTQTQTQKSEGEGVIFLANAFAPSMLLCTKSTVVFERVSAEQARRLIAGKKTVSYVGHDSTANAMAVLLGIEVPVNRSALKLTSGELIVFSLNQRLPEGKVLKTMQELESVGYTIYHVIVRCE